MEKKEIHYNQLKVNKIKPGMKFNAPVYMDEGLMFVPANISVKKKDIEMLETWEIVNVYTEGKQITDDSIQMDLPKILQKNDESTQQQVCLNIYNKVCKNLTAKFNNISGNNYFDKKEFNEIINEILISIKKYKNEFLNIVISGNQSKNRLIIHSVNCTIISIIVGMELKVTGYRMLDLATGALLHDIGKTRIPDVILNKKENLIEAEKKVIRSHSLMSYKIILKQLKYPMDQAQIGLYHHEKWNGKGYPRGLSGEKIPFLARIVAVADSYVALVDRRPYRNKHIGYNAVKVITGDNGKHYDPRITKSLLNAVGLHPIGSIVQLNNLYIGRVIENHKNAVLRPKVELLINNIGKKMTSSKVINLYNNKKLFIKKAVDPATL